MEEGDFIILGTDGLWGFLKIIRRYNPNHLIFLMLYYFN
jgi:hypothetical protein